jgi:hypothetical protein
MLFDLNLALCFCRNDKRRDVVLLNRISGTGTLLLRAYPLNKLFLFNPPLKKGDIGGFTSGCLEKIPPHPPLQRGENYLRISS